MARRTKPKRRRSKSAGQKVHTKQRALERFDIFLSDEEYRDIATSIRRGKAEFVKKQSNRVSLHRVELSGGQGAIAVYDSIRKTVVTLLFDKCKTQNRRQGPAEEDKGMKISEAMRLAATDIVKKLRAKGHVAYFAGGCVRDTLLGLTPKDYDVATDATPDKVLSLFARTKKVGAAFGVVVIRYDGHDIEVATFRKEAGYSDHRRPDNVTFTDAEEDAKRRDFTINGMFFDPISDEIVDFVGGRDDLEHRVLRAIGDPAERFSEDYLRMLRAVRFAARLGFKIEQETATAIRDNAESIRDISAERVRMELERIITAPSREDGWDMITTTGLQEHIVDGVDWWTCGPHCPADILANLRRAGTREMGEIPFPLALAAILLPLDGKSALNAVDVCQRLKCSAKEVYSVDWLLQGLHKVHAINELADLKQLMANKLWPDLLRFVRADLIARNQPLRLSTELTIRADSIPKEKVSPPALITGDDLVEMGYKPGPLFGRIIKEMRRRQLNEVVNDRETALALARQMAEEK